MISTRVGRECQGHFVPMQKASEWNTSGRLFPCGHTWMLRDWTRVFQRLICKFQRLGTRNFDVLAQGIFGALLIWVAFQKKNEAWTYLTKKKLQNPLLTPALVRRIVKFHLAFLSCQLVFSLYYFSSVQNSALAEYIVLLARPHLPTSKNPHC